VSRPLVRWSCALLVLVAAHDVTHLADEGLDTPPGELALVAVPQWLALAAVLAVIVRGDRARARAAATLLGLAVAAGFAVVHLLPGSLAPYWDQQPSAASWLLAWAPLAGGLALAAHAWSRREHPAARAAPR
jgi:hypothetical protein